jgi:hypothetical protein
MSITISSVFDDVRRAVAKENGYCSISDFNAWSRLAENRIIDFITGRIDGISLPQMYTSQKDKDIVSPFIEKYKSGLDSEGQITKPANYYTYDNMYALSLKELECDEDDIDSACDDDKKQDADTSNIEKTVIELLDGHAFYIRAKSRIKGLAPSMKKPIAKERGNYFEFLPNEIGGVTLEYIRYPIYGVAVGMMDNVYNEEVIDPNASTDYEWNENARNMLVDIIVDFFADSVRESALKNMNAAPVKV